MPDRSPFFIPSATFLISAFSVFAASLDRDLAIVFDLDPEHDRGAAHGAVLDVALVATGLPVDRYNDFLAARGTGIAGFVIQAHD